MTGVQTCALPISVIEMALERHPTQLAVRLSSRLHAPGYLRPDVLLKSLLRSFEFDSRLLQVHREAMWVERAGSVLSPLDALEESSFWRPVPVIPADPDAADPAYGGECAEKL